MSTHNICFHGEIRKTSCGYPSYLEVWLPVQKHKISTDPMKLFRRQTVMYQAFETLTPTGPWNSRAFNFSVCKALVNAPHCRDIFVAKSLLKVPAHPPTPPTQTNNPGVENDKEQQMN